MSSKALTARFGGNGGAFFDHVAQLLESDTHERLLMEYTGRMTVAVVSQRNIRKGVQRGAERGETAAGA